MAGQTAVHDTDGLSPAALREREAFLLRRQAAAERLSREGLTLREATAAATLVRVAAACGTPPYDRLTAEEVELAAQGGLTTEEAWALWRAGRAPDDPLPPPRAAR